MNSFEIQIDDIILNVNPGEDVSSAQWTLDQVIATLGAGAHVTTRQQYNTALKIKTVLKHKQTGSH